MKKRGPTKDRKTGKRRLVITPSKNESFNPKQSAWLMEKPHRTFLPYSFSHGMSSQDVTLFYDVDGLVTLKTYLRKNNLGESGYAQLLVDIALGLIWCARGGWRYFSMLFTPDNVYVDAEGHLSFVFIPFDGIPFQVENTPLTLLRILADPKRTKTVDQNTADLVLTLSDYVISENEVFSLNNFRSFIRSRCLVEVDADGHVSRMTGSRIESEVETGELPPDPPEMRGDGALIPYRGTEESSGQLPYMFVRADEGERFPLAANDIVMVGRGSDCKVRIRGNPKVSRRHLALRCMHEGVAIQDLGSSNGTTVGGQRLDPSIAMIIPYGTKFRVANESCVVRKAWHGVEVWPI